MRSSIVIIGNPSARRASVEKIRSASDFLQSKGFHAEVLITKKRGDAEVFARESVKKGPMFIIAAGGDGTINEVINGMVGSDVPLALLPLGTTNVLAKELNISAEIHMSMEKVLAGRTEKVSLGRIETGDISRYFCLMAGIGFDGRAVHDMNPSIKKISGEAAYLLSGLKSLVFYSPDELLLKIDGNEYSGHSVIVGNVSRYGGNFRITPDASLFDPSLYACIFKGRGRTDLLRYVFGVLRGKHLRYEDIAYVKAGEIEVSGTAHIQIDGDYFGVTPAKISVVKDALKLVC